ncbi:MAG: CRISPR-associated helicase Cas3' [Clostridia bacterium]|nr:CRISPR-associated helicase Cas3' [Clostridia bacterium]
MYIGHTSEDGRVQLLKDHLYGVSVLAKKFAEPFGGEEHAGRIGLLHDAGKYSMQGQKRMKDPAHTPKVDHSTAGAQICRTEYQDLIGACVISGHHGGMSDLGNNASIEGDGTLLGRLKKELSGALGYEAFWTEIRPPKGNVIAKWLSNKPFQIQMYTRMLFSCLVDADYLDTEAFMYNGRIDRGEYETISELRIKLERKISPWLSKPANELNEKRNGILRDCIRAGNGERGLYTLTVPTGGGKTIASLAFGLGHASYNNMTRIIYVIPYTSIIEQNAQVFKDILGDENVIEHHSNIWQKDDRNDAEEAMEKRRQLATENWDAPVIVTTAVQFFESLFSNKPSKCRKLHNISNSVVIFDEAQMLPVQYLQPCINVIAELVNSYQVTAVLCTATQPSLNKLFDNYYQQMKKQCRPKEICEDTLNLQQYFRRVVYERRGRIEEDEVCADLQEKDQVLCIVNTRKTAQNVFSKLPENGRFHLSTLMTPYHRTVTLKEIRRRLSSGETCRVLSTSLIEAGVDVDFPEVWRELSGLDSILQAAGRCNREGKNKKENSKVVIFSLDGRYVKKIEPNIEAARYVMDTFENFDEDDAIKTYFDELYRMISRSVESKDILDMCRKMEFESLAGAFHIIDSNMMTVYMSSDYLSCIGIEDEDAYRAYEEDLTYLKKGMVNRARIQRLSRHSVGIYKSDWEKLLEGGKIEVLDPYTGILCDANSYDRECGLLISDDFGTGLFI